ncbi:hypothetical protein L1887_59835 [Cichorium endivia]|nr:hypothetical protein L1887_59835 [Cichorium endivia]
MYLAMTDHAVREERGCLSDDLAGLDLLAGLLDLLEHGIERGRAAHDDRLRLERDVVRVHALHPCKGEKSNALDGTGAAGTRHDHVELVLVLSTVQSRAVSACCWLSGKCRWVLDPGSIPALADRGSGVNLHTAQLHARNSPRSLFYIRVGGKLPRPLPGAFSHPAGSTSHARCPPCELLLKERGCDGQARLSALRKASLRIGSAHRGRSFPDSHDAARSRADGPDGSPNVHQLRMLTFRPTACPQPSFCGTDLMRMLLRILDLVDGQYSGRVSGISNDRRQCALVMKYPQLHRALRCMPSLALTAGVLPQYDNT